MIRRYSLTLTDGRTVSALGSTVAQAIGKLPAADRQLVLLAESLP